MDKKDKQQSDSLTKKVLDLIIGPTCYGHRELMKAIYGSLQCTKCDSIEGCKEEEKERWIRKTK